MPTYTFKCNYCGHLTDRYLTFAEHERLRSKTIGCEQIDPHSPPLPVELCIGALEQVISSPMFIKGMEAGYNPTVGSYVRNDAEFRSELSRASDAATLRTGTPHNFQPIDPRDPVAAGVDGEGMEATYDHEIASGMRDTKKFM